MSLSLNKIFPHAGHDLLIRELALDSRNVRAGDLFLAVPGGKLDGREHIADALQRGAAAVAYEVDGADHLNRRVSRQNFRDAAAENPKTQIAAALRQMG